MIRWPAVSNAMFGHYYKALLQKKLKSLLGIIEEENNESIQDWHGTVSSDVATTEFQCSASQSEGHPKRRLEEVCEPHKKKPKTAEIALLPVKTPDDQ
jgi:hypothetical protein